MAALSLSFDSAKPHEIEKGRSLTFRHYVVRSLCLVVRCLDAFTGLCRLKGRDHQLTAQVRIRQDRTYIYTLPLSHRAHSTAGALCLPTPSGGRQGGHSSYE